MSCPLKLTCLRRYRKVYRSQGVEIGDKHIEVMVRQMIRKVRVMDPGDTDLLMGTLMDITDFTDANRDVLSQVEYLRQLVQSLWELPKLPLRQTASCLQLPSRKQLVSLTDAAIRGKKDHLLGLKGENVIIGKNHPQQVLEYGSLP